MQAVSRTAVRTAGAYPRTSVRTAKAYPNAADRHYFLDRFTETLLSAAICVGVIAIAFFLITML